MVEYLQAMGFREARRLGQQGVKDKGDVGGLGLPVVLELKNCRAMTIGTWMRELAEELDHSRAAVGAVVHKKRGSRDPGAQYVTMDLLSFVQLLRWVDKQKLPRED